MGGNKLMSGFLDDAFAEAQRRLERWRQEDLLSALRNRAVASKSNVKFGQALQGQDRIRLIAEFKRASPSKGPFGGNFEIEARTRAYVEGGASAVSVLTETRWFGGSLDDLVAARRNVEVPILRKDFIVNEYDLEFSEAAGADAVLLIAAHFDANRLRELLTCAGELGLAALVEAHDEGDVNIACRAGAKIIGVNSRDLRTLKVDVYQAMRTLREIPGDRTKVLESGISSARDVQASFEAGAAAVLVGEALMQSHDPANTIRQLLSPVSMTASSSGTPKGDVTLP